ncbi:MAG: hypothetical protein N4J56_001332 [Chroococcidiopsis sp. SAG 2025]|nr:hypothetical protein [Chroococcidiopsis sp. SAG 2025]MDV2991678.1 hypothetical protein [Chroococcidiopsis sp. SAG 2025]
MNDLPESEIQPLGDTALLVGTVVAVQANYYQVKLDAQLQGAGSRDELGAGEIRETRETRGTRESGEKILRVSSHTSHTPPHTPTPHTPHPTPYSARGGRG